MVQGSRDGKEPTGQGREDTTPELGPQDRFVKAEERKCNWDQRPTEQTKRAAGRE